MSIGVQSFPELFITILGWDLYGKLWDLLTQTGLVYIPFLGIILKNIAQSYVMHGFRGTEYALRNMELQLVTTLFLLFFGAAPFIPLSLHNVTFTPKCGTDQGRTFFAGSTDTTYDRAFTLPQGNIKIPIFWYAVIAISEGMTSAAKTMVGCVPDLRKMITEVDTAKINNPQTQQEVNQFTNMCYVPAKSNLLSDTKNNNASNIARIESAKKTYGIDDTEWMGSHAFNFVYYPKLRATQPIPGFPYKATEDINGDVIVKNPPAYGTPTCSDWWNDPVSGLRQRILKTLPDSFYSNFSIYLNNDAARDSILKIILTGANHPYRGYDKANNMMSDYGLSRWVSSFNILTHQVTEYPKIYTAMQAAPIIQSLILLMTYVFLPFALVFSGYKPSTFLTGAILIFSFIFWSFIWQLVSLTDKALMAALYPSWFAKQGAGATLTDFITGALVVGAPIFWFLMMTSLGIAAGSALSGLLTGLSGINHEISKSKGASQIGTAVSVASKL